MTRLLTLDRGNSTLDGCWHGEPVRRARVDPDDAAAVAALLRFAEPGQVAALTVVPGGLDAVEAEFAARGHRLLIADRDLLCPLVVAYPEPGGLGVDRWVGAVAARALYGDAVIVDCGTAVTVNLVAADGRFLGGAIAPGAATMARGLREAAPALPLADVTADLTLPATDPDAAVAAGVQLGFAGAVERLCADLVAAAGLAAPTHVVTGGLAAVLLRHARGEFHHHDDLIHQGLRCLLERPDSSS